MDSFTNWGGKTAAMAAMLLAISGLLTWYKFSKGGNDYYYKPYLYQELLDQMKTSRDFNEAERESPKQTINVVSSWMIISIILFGMAYIALQYETTAKYSKAIVVVLVLGAIGSGISASVAATSVKSKLPGDVSQEYGIYFIPAAVGFGLFSAFLIYVRDMKPPPPPVVSS
jgi:hypothetical protein